MSYNNVFFRTSQSFSSLLEMSCENGSMRNGILFHKVVQRLQFTISVELRGQRSAGVFNQ